MYVPPTQHFRLGLYPDGAGQQGRQGGVWSCGAYKSGPVVRIRLTRVQRLADSAGVCIEVCDVCVA